jgi:hypothetical protein
MLECLNYRRCFACEIELTDLRKATVNLVMPVCPSSWKNSAHTGWILLSFDIGVFFENLFLENSDLIKIGQE